MLPLLLLSLATLAACRPDIADRPEARQDDTSLRQSRRSSSLPYFRKSVIDNNIKLDSEEKKENPVLEYILQQKGRNDVPAGARREIVHFQSLPNQKTQNGGSTRSGHPFRRDPTKSPYENFTGYILAGRKPEDSLVTSPDLEVKDRKNSSVSEMYTTVQSFPFVATVTNTFDNKGVLRSSVTRYETSATSQPLQPSGPQAKQQITWPYAQYFPILIRDPFLSAFNAFTTGQSFTFSSLVEYGPEADICRSRRDHGEQEELSERGNSEEHSDRVEEEPIQVRTNLGSEDDEEQIALVRRLKRSTRVTIADKDKGAITLRIEAPSQGSGEPVLSVRKGGTSIAGPGGYATAYTGGTAIVGPYGTVFKSPQGVAIAGPYSKIINITDDTSFAEIHQMYEAEKLNKTKSQQPNSFSVNRKAFSSGPLMIQNGRSLSEEINRLVQTEPEIPTKPESSKNSFLHQHLMQDVVHRSNHNLETKSNIARKVDDENKPTPKAFKAIRKMFSYRSSHPVMIQKHQGIAKGKSLAQDSANLLNKTRDELKNEWETLRNKTRENYGAVGNETTLVLAPRSKAEAGKDGVAVSAPISHAVMMEGQSAHVVFEPLTSASAGPGGFAHAHSDLFVSFLKKQLK